MSKTGRTALDYAKKVLVVFAQFILYHSRFSATSLVFVFSKLGAFLKRLNEGVLNGNIDSYELCL